MIRYKRGTWFSQLYRWRGGSFEQIWIQSLAYCIYCLVIFWRAGEQPVIGDKAGSAKILGGFATFSLVFTLNQCYSRYLEGVHLTAHLFAGLLALNSMACSYAGACRNTSGKGGLENLSPADLRMVIATQVHVARLTLAFAVAFAVHRYIIESAVTGKAISDESHVAILFELTRLRGLLLEEELPLIDAATGLLVQQKEARDRELSRDGCCGCERCGCSCCSCCWEVKGERLCVNWRYKSGVLSPDLQPLRSLPGDYSPGGPRKSKGFGYSGWEVMGVSLMVPIAQLMRHHIAVAANQRWGFPERFLNLFEASIQKSMEFADRLEQLVSDQMPMAYLQQRKMLFLAFVLVYPLTLPNSDGWWTNVITPMFIFMAMMGFESVAEMLENPLGDDSLDLNVDEMLHDLEVRVCKVLTMAPERLGRIHEAGEELLANMPLDEDDQAKASDADASSEKERVESLRRLAQDWGFNAHFVWRPVPPQVLVSSLDQMHAEGRRADEEMRDTILHQENAESDSDVSSDPEEGSFESTSSFRATRAGRAESELQPALRREGLKPSGRADAPPLARRVDSRLDVGHRPTVSGKDLYRAVSLMRGRDKISRHDLLGIDHFLCLRIRAPDLEVVLEEFGREYVRDKKSAGAGGRLLSRLHEMWMER